MLLSSSFVVIVILCWYNSPPIATIHTYCCSPNYHIQSDPRLSDFQSNPHCRKHGQKTIRSRMKEGDAAPAMQQDLYINKLSIMPNTITSTASVAVLALTPMLCNWKSCLQDEYDLIDSECGGGGKSKCRLCPRLAPMMPRSMVAHLTKQHGVDSQVLHYMFFDRKSDIEFTIAHVAR